MVRRAEWTGGEKSPFGIKRAGDGMDLGGFDRIVFGHSELSGAQMWETAALEGERAAKQDLLPLRQNGKTDSLAEF